MGITNGWGEATDAGYVENVNIESNRYELWQGTKLAVDSSKLFHEWIATGAATQYAPASEFTLLDNGKKVESIHPVEHRVSDVIVKGISVPYVFYLNRTTLTTLLIRQCMALIANKISPIIGIDGDDPPMKKQYTRPKRDEKELEAEQSFYGMTSVENAAKAFTKFCRWDKASYIPLLTEKLTAYDISWIWCVNEFDAQVVSDYKKCLIAGVIANDFDFCINLVPTFDVGPMNRKDPATFNSSRTTRYFNPLTDKAKEDHPFTFALKHNLLLKAAIVGGDCDFGGKVPSYGFKTSLQLLQKTQIEKGATELQWKDIFNAIQEKATKSKSKSKKKNGEQSNDEINLDLSDCKNAEWAFLYQPVINRETGMFEPLNPIPPSLDKKLVQEVAGWFEKPTGNTAVDRFKTFEAKNSTAINLRLIPEELWTLADMSMVMEKVFGYPATSIQELTRPAQNIRPRANAIVIPPSIIDLEKAKLVSEIENVEDTFRMILKNKFANISRSSIFAAENEKESIEKKREVKKWKGKVLNWSGN